MTHPTLTVDLVLPVLDELVNANPNFVYKAPGNEFGCKYAYAGEPSCLVGQVLGRLGWTVEELARIDHLDEIDDYGVDGTVIDEVIRVGIVDAEEQATRLLAAVQQRQDRGDPWAIALEGAKAAVFSDDSGA